MNSLAARIAQLESQVRAQGEAINSLARELGIDPGAIDPPGYVDAEELDMLRDGRAIHAIKHHRERTGSSLLQAKEAVDRASES
ncbi:MAG: hypothetical protein Q4P15_12115 [Propionibacteriaceae bacterium]|nr:hypothetical protein [Propionibacteriaceae bacterium]